MAPENNWLSFSLSSMEMLSSSSSPATIKFIPPFDAAASSADSHHPFYYSDHFYSNATWQDSKPEVTVARNHMAGGGGHHQQQHHLPHHDQGSIYTSFLDQNHPPPKLEDFLGGDSTETQDSSLTHIYDHGGGGAANSAYFSEHPHHHHQQHDLKSITGFQAFSTNSGSEVDDSASAARNQVMCGEFTGQSIESGTELVPYPQTQCPNSGALTLAVRNNGTKSDAKPSAQNAIVPADSNKRLTTETFGQRTSVYRGVTRHRWTGRYEAHLWDNSCRREGQARKGRQVYLGGYDKEDKAARAYDLAALKYWGPSATTNLPVSTYAKEIEDMKHCTKQEFIASLRRKSSGFSRGASVYRGVTRHHQQGRWQARIGRVAGNKDLYLGTFATEEEAAEAYDIAAIKFRGLSAVTNFEMNRYDVETIMRSALPIGPAAKRLKLSLEAEQKQMEEQQNECSSGTINFASFQPITCAMPYDATTAPPPYYHQNLFNHHLNPTDNAAVSQHEATGAASTMVASMPMMLQTPGEFYIWPHQSY